jgi:hypothetical protein
LGGAKISPQILAQISGETGYDLPRDGIRSPPPLQPSGKSPCLDHYGRGVFGGNGTRVGLVPMVDLGFAVIAATAVLSCHIEADLRVGLFFCLLLCLVLLAQI